MQIKYNNIVLNEENSFLSFEAGQLGNLAIEASDDYGFYYYLFTYTQSGVVWICSFGPLVREEESNIDATKTFLNFFLSNNQINRISMQLESMIFNQGKLINIITRFLNDPKKKISQAKILTDKIIIINLYKEYIGRLLM